MTKTSSSGIQEIDISIFKKDWKDKIVIGNELKDDNLLSISTSSIKLDWALKRPFIEGSIVEIFGPNSSGKSTIALEVCSNAMKLGKDVYYCDIERKLKEAQLAMIDGLNRDKFAILYPDTGEEAIDMMHECILSNPGSVFVLDSVGALLPEVEDAEDVGKQTRALVARLCHKMIRKVTGIASRNKCLIIFINHLTATMAMYGKATTTHGGKAIQNRASQRIELFAPSAGKIKSGGDVIGQMVRCTTIKNNVFRPFITVNVPLIFGKGIDSDLDLFQFAEDMGVFVKKGKQGGFYQVPGFEKMKRQGDILELFKVDMEYKNSIKNKLDILLS